MPAENVEPQAGPAPKPVYRTLLPGDRLPSMRQTCAGVPGYSFDVLAGGYQLFGFFLAADRPQIREAIAAIQARGDLFNDAHCAFTGVSTTRADRQIGFQDEPGRRFAWDFDNTMSIACGAVPQDTAPGAPTGVQRKWILVDPSLHVLRVFPMNTTPVEEVIAAVAALPPPDRFGGISRPAPILVLPNVLEPALCEELIGRYQAHGGDESGVYRDGKGVLDATFKRRKDYKIDDADLINRLNGRIARRVMPEVERLFFMRCAYIERHIVGCYSADDGGHFSPHYDNAPGLTAHRRFAVSINLNDGFGGGEVVFPEYNAHGYKAPAGWAVVFPCAAMHAVHKVTSGLRYAFLPFIYDESGRAIRMAENARLQKAADAEA